MEGLVQLAPAAPRLPPWLRKPQSNFETVQSLKTELRRLRLHTVCESARCPNLHECFHRGAATFMILGNLCTRGCGFCSVPKSRHPGALDPEEPANVARMAQQMRLRYVVITSVNRDDLPDGGSAHFAATVREVRAALPEAQVEVLTPDFVGDLDAVRRVLDAGPDVFNHNIETVERLYKTVRPQAIYSRSLDVLRFAKRYRPRTLTKSGAMLGLGETTKEVEHLLCDLRSADVDAVTLGQYLQPTRRNLPVHEFVRPERFEGFREYGLQLGFKLVFSGPFVRSSYMADVQRTAPDAGTCDAASD
jgi:lipoic acid synthetase